MSWIPRGPTVTNHQATIARSDGKNHDKLPVMKFEIKKTFQPLNVKNPMRLTLWMVDWLTLGILW